MMALSVTSLTEDEGAEVDGAVKARGAAISVWIRLQQSYATLHLTVLASMAHMNVK